MHYGLLPRANRGIFAINELPDLAGKIQVGLFNILQEGDVQIKGYPIRLKLDVMLVFTANPEDYTARGKIITPLKDRIGSEIRTHYPVDARQRDGDHQAGSVDRSGRARSRVEIPDYVREVVEEIAFQARADRKVDKRSGVSQRLPITTLELVVSNAERRAPRQRREARRPARHRHLRRAAVDHRQVRAGIRGRTARRRNRSHAISFARRSAPCSPASSTASTRAPSSSGSISAASLQLGDNTSADDVIAQTRGVQGLRELADRCWSGEGRGGAGGRLRDRLRARRPVCAEEDQPQRRARLRRRRAALRAVHRAARSSRSKKRSRCRGERRSTTTRIRIWDWI